MSPFLSICIPTCNRAPFLAECLQSVYLSLVAAESQDVEIVISDNASTDYTAAVIEEFRKRYARVVYSRNDSNLGFPGNFLRLADLASGRYHWYLGDDDLITPDAIATTLAALKGNYSLVVCASVSIGAEQSRRVAEVDATGDELHHPDQVMRRMALRLGYLSSLVVDRNLIALCPQEQWRRFEDFGFVHMFAVYYGLLERCDVLLLSRPTVLYRRGNSGGYDWYKYFALGSTLIFDELRRAGYGRRAVVSAKRQALWQYILPQVRCWKLGLASRPPVRLLLRCYLVVPCSLAAVGFVGLLPRWTVRTARHLKRRLTELRHVEKNCRLSGPVRQAR